MKDTEHSSRLLWAKSFAEGLTDGVVILDQSMQIIWWNRVAKHLLNLRRSHQNNPITEILHSPSFFDYIQSNERGTIEMPAPRAPDRMLSLLLIPYSSFSILIAQDISYRHHIDRMRQDFVANVSHEMRTPLTVIQGYLEMMQDEVVETLPHWQSYIHQMNQQMRRLESLLEDLLLLTKLQSQELSDDEITLVDVAQILFDLVEQAKVLSNNKHQFQIDINPKLHIYGHAKELESCFGNLIMNAVRYSPDGGMIDIVWSYDQTGGHFYVKDQGIGIAEKHIPRLTERFYRVDKGRSRKTGGTGLGLSIVKYVLLRHHANLYIHSELGKGSLFRCDFPANCISWQTKDKPSLSNQ
ncbi:phosphate regulon sensor histidine kinase PhoR [Thiotrichales bacterium 19S3-7]|nr:phosphate regulon sensor histidine kinase PhoR [Thiotrichales bacterium 19S3-7]MCF6800583.1 phosphate regulon sensor histidine kinase PhoR [Thiotrichales bacterium 19S3-11]